METAEKIPVYVDIRKGKTVCICRRDKKLCGKQCAKDVVTRDKFEGWFSTFHRDVYGR